MPPFRGLPASSANRRHSFLPKYHLLRHKLHLNFLVGVIIINVHLYSPLPHSILKNNHEGGVAEGGAARSLYTCTKSTSSLTRYLFISLYRLSVVVVRCCWRVFTRSYTRSSQLLSSYVSLCSCESYMATTAVYLPRM